MAGISEGEVAVYDRQLRLWGVQAQQRLLKAKVLLWGLEGCNVEAAKNLVLAGVSLTIRDHRTVGIADVAYNYFLREDDMGKGRAESTAKRVQEMNPLCTVSSSSAPVGPCDDVAALSKELAAFDVLCLGFGVLDFDVKKAQAIDAACRAAGCCFILSVTCGELACFFSDLHKHTMQERSGTQGSQPGGKEESASQVEEFDFPSLEAWLSSSPRELQEKKVDDSIVLVSLFLAFAKSKASGGPTREEGGSFTAFCQAQTKALPNVDGMADLNHAYSCFFVEPLMHVASVLAGLLSQEVIKAITKKDPPLMNTVCFNAHTSVGLVERVPAAPKQSVKRKAAEIAEDVLD